MSLLRSVISEVGACLKESSRRVGVGLVAVLLAAGGVAAQEGEGAPRQDASMVSVLLRPTDGGPRPSDVVGYDFQQGEVPPIKGMLTSHPLGAKYLLAIRANGDALEYLEQHPDDPEAVLERYVFFIYPEGADTEAAAAAMRTDPNVEYAYAHVPATIYPDPEPIVAPHPARPETTTVITQQWRTDSGIDDTWNTYAGGWSLIGEIDVGVEENHPDMVPLSAGVPTGGPFLSNYSLDLTEINALNEPVPSLGVDEKKKYPIGPVNRAACDDDSNDPSDVPDSMMSMQWLGHGTHVAGLIAANASSGSVVKGACKNCVIGVMKIMKPFCGPTGGLQRTSSIYSVIGGIKYLSSLGAQVINMSFAIESCAPDSLDPQCKAIRAAEARGVLLVGAAGNNRADIQFPAADPGVTSAGGTDPLLAYWDEDKVGPNFTDGCPTPSNPAECGSNFTLTAGTKRLEVVAQAKDVMSTAYTGRNWNYSCGDSYGAGSTSTDGAGYCTGTSMSAPIIAGVAGLLRSINPMVMPGNPENASDALGVRDVLADSAIPAITGEWDAHYGYGRVQAKQAAQMMLGTVKNTQMVNRLIPLFQLYSSGATDYASVATPQSAGALMRDQTNRWLPTGNAIPGYTSFPVAVGDIDGTVPTPKAYAYVFSTEFKMKSSHPNLVPLYWLSRPTTNDHALFLFDDVNDAVAAGYEYRGRQGYIMSRCEPEPACIPAGAVKLYRKYNPSLADNAVFTDNENAAMTAAGYTATYPVATTTTLGYVFPNISSPSPDGDTDGLPDIYETLIGTLNTFDSDGDGRSDGAEYPFAGVPTGDPCSNGACLGNELIFASSFE